MLTAIVGINWGDEGKGRMVDLLTRDYDVVVRYQGGGNAGHTVVNEQGKFALHLLPSGIFRKGVVNILGNGVALDCESLWTEIQDVTSKGVAITPENLKISDRASLLLPWHRDLDGLEEARLADRHTYKHRQSFVQSLRFLTAYFSAISSPSFLPFQTAIPEPCRPGRAPAACLRYKQIRRSYRQIRLCSPASCLPASHTAQEATGASGSPFHSKPVLAARPDPAPLRPRPMRPDIVQKGLH